jgi:NADPH-dependent curcumin reductase CurA
MTTGWRSNILSREIRLAARPAGAPQPSDFELAEVEVGDPGDGEIVVRNTFMSVHKLSPRASEASSTRCVQPVTSRRSAGKSARSISCCRPALRRWKGTR